MTTKGIGWLIAGVLVCISALEETVFLSAVSTVVIGLVFIAVYLMKQKYYPIGIGWFISGGLVISYCIEAKIRNESVYNAIVAMVVAAVCFGVFYYRNREIAEMMAEDLDEMADPLYVGRDNIEEDVAGDVNSDGTGNGGEELPDAGSSTEDDD